MNIIEKRALFSDYKNNEQYAEIRINESMFIWINTFDSNNNPTGYMNIFFHPNNRLFLETIYCYDQFRKSGIATLISELADYILKDYEGYVIRGVYEPGQLSTDRENNIERSQEELKISARKFYEKNGYVIIDYEEYSKNKNKYSYLNIKYKNHKLINDKYFKECHECYIEPYGLLIYKFKDNELILLLIATGSHSALLK